MNILFMAAAVLAASLPGRAFAQARGILAERKAFLEEIEAQRPTEPTLTHTLQASGPIAFNGDGSLALIGSTLFDARSWKVAGYLDGHKQAVTAAAVSQDGRIAATASWHSRDKTAILWELPSGRQARAIKGPSAILSLALSPDGSRLVTGHHNKSAIIWDVATGKRVLELIGNENTVYAVAYSPSGEKIATAGADEKIHIWDAKTGKRTHWAEGSLGAIISLAFTPNGDKIISGSDKGMVEATPVNGGRGWKPLFKNVGKPYSIAVSPNGKKIVAAGTIPRLFDEVSERFSFFELTASRSKGTSFPSRFLPGVMKY